MSYLEENWLLAIFQVWTTDKATAGQWFWSWGCLPKLVRCKFGTLPIVFFFSVPSWKCPSLKAAGFVCSNVWISFLIAARMSMLCFFCCVGEWQGIMTYEGPADSDRSWWRIHRDTILERLLHPVGLFYIHSPNMSLHENSCELCSYAVDGQDSKTRNVCWDHETMGPAGDYLDDAKHGFGKFTWPNMNARGLSLTCFHGMLVDVRIGG